MKKIAGTVVTAVIVAALMIAAIVMSDSPITSHQQDTLKILLIICGCSVAYCFIVGELAQNFSQMDKLWSILPIVYTWVIAAQGGMKPRLILYALIVTAWGVRLTVNFARKGAYRLKFWTGEEDYRWSIVRQSPLLKPRVAWMLFDLFFISLYQNALVLAITLPALAGMESTASIGVWDILGAAAAVAFLMLELVADEYQWRFHQTKKKLLSEGKTLAELPMPYRLGFNITGPWARMRHPNYLGEQGIWMSLYFLAVGAGVTNSGFHWSAVGPLLLILLFMGSSTLGESISSKKYPRYRDYIDQVCKYLPVHRFNPD